jgi:hypothetical protein
MLHWDHHHANSTLPWYHYQSENSPSMKRNNGRSNSPCEDIDGDEIGGNPTTVDIKLAKYRKQQRSVGFVV